MTITLEQIKIRQPQTVQAAIESLEQRGLKFAVDFGYQNAIEKECDLLWNDFHVYRHSEGHEVAECEVCDGWGFIESGAVDRWLVERPLGKPECEACLGTGFSLPTPAQWAAFWAELRNGELREREAA